LAEPDEQIMIKAGVAPQPLRLAHDAGAGLAVTILVTAGCASVCAAAGQGEESGCHYQAGRHASSHGTSAPS
jgi:hypothetical protein